MDLVQPFERSITFDRNDLPRASYYFVEAQLREQIEEEIRQLPGYNRLYETPIPDDAIRVTMTRPEGQTSFTALYSPDTRDVYFHGGPLDGRTHEPISRTQIDVPAIDDGQPRMVRYEQQGIDFSEHRWVYVYVDDQE